MYNIKSDIPYRSFHIVGPRIWKYILNKFDVIVPISQFNKIIGSSMSAVMLLFCYLPMTMIIIIFPVVLYSMFNNCISNIFVVISYNYELYVSIKFISSSSLT